MPEQISTENKKVSYPRAPLHPPSGGLSERPVHRLKAIDGFYLSPQNTKFIFIGPDEPGFGHQRLLDSECKRVCTWEKDTILFSIPNRKHFIPEKTVYDSDGRHAV